MSPGEITCGRTSFLKALLSGVKLEEWAKVSVEDFLVEDADDATDADGSKVEKSRVVGCGCLGNEDGVEVEPVLWDCSFFETSVEEGRENGR